jgi:hypothetical protein
VFQDFSAERLYHLSWLRLFQIEPVHQHRQLFGAYRYAMRFSLTIGQRKRPFSSRFAYTHNPLPSHTRAFKRVRVRLENQNRNGLEAALITRIGPPGPWFGFGCARSGA